MPLLTSLLALVLLALSGGVTMEWADAPSADVPTEAPVSHDAPVDAEEMDGEEDGVRRPQARGLGVAVFSLAWDGTEVASVVEAVHSPPPER